MKLDRQIQDSYKIQKQDRMEKERLNKKLKESMRMVDSTTTENVNLKVELQIQKDLIKAMKLQVEINKEEQAEKRNETRHE